MTEADYLANVIELATTTGHLVHHDRGDYSLCIGGDPGFPDLVMARRGRVVFAELKSDTGTATHSQRAWLEALAGRPIDRGESITFDAMTTVGLWRPADIGEVAAALTARPAKVDL